MKYQLIVLLLGLILHEGTALECYSCDSASSGAACELDPQTTVLCSGGYDYCYTRRVEEEGQADVSIDRGCCRVEAGSPTCPEGDNYQVMVEDSYTAFLSRCQGDLCNDGDGL